MVLILIIAGVTGVKKTPLKLVHWHYMGDLALAYISEQKEYAIFTNNITKI